MPQITWLEAFRYVGEKERVRKKLRKVVLTVYGRENRRIQCDGDKMELLFPLSSRGLLLISFLFFTEGERSWKFSVQMN